MSVSVPTQAAVGPAVFAEAGRETGEAGRGRGETEPARVHVDDRMVRAIGIPAFGLVIPRLTGLLDPTPPSTAEYWLGSVGFVMLSAAIWHGNRWLLFAQRRHYGWFDHPMRKVVLLLAAIVLFTVPLTIAGLSAWYGWVAHATDWGVIRTVVLANVVCVVFVTHVYETVFLIKERESDLVRVAQLDRARSEAELAAFLAQIDPHFMFNCLNTLGHLIDIDPVRARAFNDNLADIHRRLLQRRGLHLIPIADELAFLHAYVALLRIRFGSDFVCSIRAHGHQPAGALVPPNALQLLVENAVKHNEVGEGHALEINVTVADDFVSVDNRRRPRRSVRESAGLGLRNLDERTRLAIGRGIDVEHDSDRFMVRVPLARVHQ